ncbi:saccharopine dehydrogenase-like oxidoreductase [Hamiltosporidium tvaerminnensis]|uniref:Saccharopine dehydrogenase-like oxidoreductase n=1 Tax=Hamiltosporidium tvaerminnensis TaxID=1176355 RepID=A0A4Q9LC25_9MICR|nr:hypothetical protein LUQ84_001181 [Hamiltosporidium tvaerminnensis]TBU04905.1 saccharopine dehydrogenase-like oxidoreductase [Hamiltosporidium tvaerminnensis]TBU12141.1 saccharopine dehydrogenase-like oxidoreductase [Hamiltosporidium tvaerminnensis]TBU12988.1 saccharopine dehydrogenase-like oxidoreductase [Hamiltosporidium tvaerminnensis]TBU13242.1 saccharopine dehydrogenase-like oxidoreductase [Hamiltosporidium tvaerminnensis]
MKEYDIIIYGASGYTARFVIERLIKEQKRIALAGRSLSNINKNIISLDLKEDIEIFEVTVDNIDIITSKTKVLVNCCGPYIFTGEKIVKSCIEHRTHYLDITGETLFIERILNKYGEMAKRNGVFILNCCGFDSVPADMGFEYLKKHMNVDNFECESVMSLKNSFVNVATYQSLIYGLGNIQELRKLRRNEKKVKNKKIKKIFYNKLTQSYCVIFMGTDASVVKRSQNMLEEHDLSKKGEYSAYFEVGSLKNLILFMFYFGMIYFLSKFKFGRKILLAFPGFFSCYRIKPNGPTLSEIENASFSIVFWGKGVASNGEIIRNKLKIDGGDPGYITTATCLTHCTVVLLNMLEEKEMGIKNSLSLLEGGIFTPASVFSETDLIDRLCLKGVNFNIE